MATVLRRTSAHAEEVPLLGKGLKLAEGMKGEDLHIEANVEEEVDDGPGHV